MLNPKYALSEKLAAEDLKRLEELAQENWELLSGALREEGWPALERFPEFSGALGSQYIDLGGSGEFLFANFTPGGCGWVGHPSFRPTGGIVIAYGENRDVACAIIDPGAGFHKTISLLERILKAYYGMVPPVRAIVGSHMHPDHVYDIEHSIQYATMNAKRRGEVTLAVNYTIAMGAPDAKGRIQDYFHSKVLPKGMIILTPTSRVDEVKRKVEEQLARPGAPFFCDGVEDKIDIPSPTGKYELSLEAKVACHHETGKSDPLNSLGFCIYADREPRAVITGDSAFYRDPTKPIPSQERIYTRTTQLKLPEGGAKALVELRGVVDQYKGVRGVPIVVAHIARGTYQVWQGEFITYDDNHGRLDLAYEVAEKTEPSALIVNEQAAENYRVHPKIRGELRKKFGVVDFLEFAYRMLREQLPDTEVVVPSDYNIVVI